MSNRYPQSKTFTGLSPTLGDILGELSFSFQASSCTLFHIHPAPMKLTIFEIVSKTTFMYVCTLEKSVKNEKVE